MADLGHNLLSVDTLFSLALVSLLGYSLGWFPLALPLVLLAATMLRMLAAGQKQIKTFFIPPGILPLLFLAALPLAQLVPFPPAVLKTIFPATARLYGESLWLVLPGAWMPVSVYPQVTLNAFFAVSLGVTVYLLTANLFREPPRAEKFIAFLTIAAALPAVLALVQQVMSLLVPGFLGRSAAHVPASGSTSMQAQFTILFPLLLLFIGHRFSLLRHLPLREKFTGIFVRKVPGDGSLAAAMLAFVLLCLYAGLVLASIFSAVVAMALTVAAIRLLLHRQRRFLGRLALVAAGCFCLAAILADRSPSPGASGYVDSPAPVVLGGQLLQRMETTINALKFNPLMGAGMGAGSLVSERRLEIRDRTAAQTVRSRPFEFAAGAGLTGVCLAGWFCLTLSRWFFSRQQEPRGRLAACLLTASFTGLLTIVILLPLNLAPAGSSLWLFFFSGLAVAVCTLPVVSFGVEERLPGTFCPSLKVSAVVVVLVAIVCVMSALGGSSGKILLAESSPAGTERQMDRFEAASAMRRARFAAVLDPLEGRYHSGQAELYLAAGNPLLARKQYLAALRRDPANGEYLQSLGSVLAGNGEMLLGEKLIRAGLNDQQSIAERQKFVVRWLLAAARKEDAMLAAREGLSRSPEETRSFLQLMVLGGVSLADLRRALPNSSRCYLDYAEYQRESGDLPGADETSHLAFGLALDEQDAAPDIFRRLYRVFSGDGNDEAALAALQAGLQLYPANAEFRYLAAETYRRLGLHLRAAEEYRKLQLTDPHNQQAQQALKDLAAK